MWETSDEESDDDSLNGRRQNDRKMEMPAGLDWLGGIVKPIDDMGKNIGQLFCPFLVPQTQDAMVKEYCQAGQTARPRPAAQGGAAPSRATLQTHEC